MSGLRGGPAFRVLMAFSKKRRKLSRYESTIEGHWFGMLGLGSKFINLARTDGVVSRLNTYELRPHHAPSIKTKRRV